MNSGRERIGEISDRNKEDHAKLEDTIAAEKTSSVERNAASETSAKDDIKHVQPCSMQGKCGEYYIPCTEECSWKCQHGGKFGCFAISSSNAATNALRFAERHVEF